MKKLVCALMAFVMMVLCFALYSCKNENGPETTGEGTEKVAEPASIVGTWTTTVQGEQFLFPSDKWDTGSREWNGGTIKLSLAFGEGGFVVLGLSKPDTRAFLADNLEAAVTMFGATVEEVMEDGKFETEDDVVDALLDTVSVLNKNGKYTFEDGVLTTELVSMTHTHGGEEEEEVPASIKVTVTEDTLTFTEYVVDSEEHALFDSAVLPLTFQRRD